MMFTFVDMFGPWLCFSPVLCWSRPLASLRKGVQWGDFPTRWKHKRVVTGQCAVAAWSKCQDAASSMEKVIANAYRKAAKRNRCFLLKQDSFHWGIRIWSLRIFRLVVFVFVVFVVIIGRFCCIHLCPSNSSKNCVSFHLPESLWTVGRWVWGSIFCGSWFMIVHGWNEFWWMFGWLSHFWHVFSFY